MPVQLRVRIEGDDIVAALRALERQAADLTPAMDEIGQALATSTQQRFLDAEGPDGRPWPELSEATKAMRGQDAEPLRDRGHLFDSITWRAGAGEVAIGSARKYARIHQLGGEAGRGLKVSIPARPYLGVDDADRREISEILQTHLGG